MTGMLRSDTFDFLKQVKTNNNREWFQAHKDLHDTARENVLAFTADVITGLTKIDLAIPSDLNPKDCVMRIYRDVRFSKDKTPYKTNFGTGISPNGKNFNGPGYYLHLSPEQSFIAGGCWMPPANQLKAIRQEIDYNSSDFQSILDDQLFKHYFDNLDREGALKTAPKGYPADHPSIEVLKLKSFTASTEITIEELLHPDAVKRVLERFEALHSFIVFLRNAIV